MELCSENTTVTPDLQLLSVPQIQRDVVGPTTMNPQVGQHHICRAVHSTLSCDRCLRLSNDILQTNPPIAVRYQMLLHA